MWAMTNVRTSATTTSLAEVADSQRWAMLADTGRLWRTDVSGDDEGAWRRAGTNLATGVSVALTTRWARGTAGARDRKRLREGTRVSVSVDARGRRGT